MKQNIFFTLLFLCCCAINVNAQNFDDMFVTYTPVYTPPRPIYTAPMPNIVDNSVTIIDNSYHASASQFRCVDSQTQRGQILLIDLTDNSDMVVDAEVLFKTYSNKSASISISKIKIDNHWHSIGVSAYKLADLLDDPTFERKDILALLEVATFYAISNNVLFLF